MPTRGNNVEEQKNRTIADLTIEEAQDGSLGFVSAEYTETINGLLPRLVARFYCDADKIPVQLTNVNLTMRVRDSQWNLKANIDDMKFNINTLTIFFTLAPKDFYYVSTSNKFNSIQNAVKSLYYSTIDNESLLDSRLLEVNQVGVTSHRFLNMMLGSLRSPSVFAYTLNSLNLNELVFNSPNLKIVDPAKASYYIEDNKKKRYLRQDLLESNPTYSEVISRNSQPSGEMLEWGGMKITYNNDYKDYIRNLVDNSIEQKNLKLTTRVTSQADLELNAGDIVQISLPDLDTDRYLVMDKLFIIGDEIKFNYGLRGLNT